MTIKTREFKESNYRGIWFQGKTIRIALDPTLPITELEYPEFYDVKITDYCEGACPWCLTEDTEISTIDGLKVIKDVKEGDTIINVNSRNMNLITSPVTQLYKRKHEGEMIEITTEDGNMVKITPNHKVYTTNRGWVEAGKLNENDDLFILK